MIKLEPLPKGLCDPELERMLADQLEYEGWQEAATLYKRVHEALKAAEPKIRARALMDHARVLRQLELKPEAELLEREAEELVGGPIEREAAPKSSTDELIEKNSKSKGFFGKLFGK